MNDLFNDKSAVFSPDRIYRYLLWRWWDHSLPYVLFVGLNPSTADETVDDPTIRRCISFAHSWGYGGLCMVNLFALRATEPKIMLAHLEPVGFYNDQAIYDAHMRAGLTIAAWGVHGQHMGRADTVREFLQDLYCLGTTKEGFPRHPLYIRADQQPQPYEAKTLKLGGGE